MNYWIFGISFIGQYLIKSIMGLNWAKYEDKIISKSNDKVIIKMVKSWFKLLNTFICMLDTLFKYAILGAIVYLISEKVGQFEAISFLLITISVKLSQNLTKK